MCSSLALHHIAGQVLEMMRSVGTVMLIVPRGVNRVLMAYWMGLNRWQIPDMEARAPPEHRYQMLSARTPRTLPS